MRILNNVFGSWKWWENVENKDNRWQSEAIRNFFLSEIGTVERRFRKQLLYMVHSDVIWNDIRKVGTAEDILEARTQNGALWRFLKQCLRSRNCLENFKSKDAKWCMLVLFETMFLKLEMLRFFLKQGCKMVHSGSI